jgi:SAM-dependent methyltransferase
MKRLAERALPALVLALAIFATVSYSGYAQEKSVRPGINKPFEDPDVPKFIEVFEGESREIYVKRQDIVAACQLKPGMAVADIGAGTGLFTRLFAPVVGIQGRVYAVDIARKFIDHIAKTCQAQGIKNVTGVVCTQASTELPPGSIDLAFICDTYHHFEFPAKTMRSIYRALRPGGRVVLVDFKRIPGVSSEWVMNHVRAGQEKFTQEIAAAGFKPVGERKILKENYLVVFQKGEALQADRAVVGLIPRARKPIKLDGKLNDWDGAFITPVHVGHPDFANRGGQFLFLWDDQNLYIGLRCLDRHPAHFGSDNQLWNGDAVEFYLDTRRGDQLGAEAFGRGTLHMFWTAFTQTAVQPRMAVRDLPAFKDFKLHGAEVVGEKTAWGYTAEFKLPWANFPNFTPQAGAILGIDCELCSSDDGLRVDRTFVYSSPAAVSSPSAFGRVQLVEQLDGQALKPMGRSLLPLSLTKSANYAWLYGTVCLSPTIEGSVARLEGKIVDRDGKVRKTTAGSRQSLDGTGFILWTGSWELFDLPPGVYTLELAALDKDGSVIASRKERLLHGDLQEHQP